MATCEKKVVTTENYVLTLSEDEMALIVLLVGSITGHKENSPRKFANQIYFALPNSILDDHRFRKYVDPKMDRIHFKNF